MTIATAFLLAYLAAGLAYARLGHTRIRELRNCYGRISEHGLFARLGLGAVSVLFWPAMLLAVVSYRLTWKRRLADASEVRRHYLIRIAAVRVAAAATAQAFDDLRADDSSDPQLRGQREALYTAARLELAERCCDLLDGRCPDCEGRIFAHIRGDISGSVCSACAAFKPIDEMIELAEHASWLKPSQEDLFA